MRNLKQPLKKPSMVQSKNRTLWKQITGSWSQLTGDQRDSWNEAAPTGKSGFQLYNETNMVMIGLGLTPLTDYVAPITPPDVLIDSTATQTEYTPTRSFTVSIFSSDDSLPTTGWTPYFRWSGLVKPGGVYSGPYNRIVSKEGTAANIDSSGIASLDETAGANLESLAPYASATIVFSWVNNTTGQIITPLVFSYVTPT